VLTWPLGPCRIEQHYSASTGAHTMDIEWAKDASVAELCRRGRLKAGDGGNPPGRRPCCVGLHLEASLVRTDQQGRGRFVPRCSSGWARVIRRSHGIDQFEIGDLLVTTRRPDWEPILKKAAGVITKQGGRPCHCGDIA